MKKTIRLTESELTRLIKRIVSENKPPIKNVIDLETGEMVGTHQYGVGFTPNRIGIEMGYEPHPTSIPDGTKMDRSSMEDRIFKPRSMRLRGDSDEDRWS